MNVLVMLILLLSFQTLSSDIDIQVKLKNAFESYQQGVTAKTFTERKKAFNQSFVLYMEASRYSDSAKLNYNIGNCFFQLEEYAWAILYYNRALNLEPNNQASISNLLKAQEKLGIEVQTGSQSLLELILTFNNMITLPERFLMFFLCGVSVLSIASIYIWIGLRWIKTLLLYCIIIFSVMLLNIIISQYGLPIEAVVVKTTYLYRDAGWQYPAVVETPVWAGTKVQIMDEQKHGKWLKVYIRDGLWGYVPNESARLITVSS